MAEFFFFLKEFEIWVFKVLITHNVAVHVHVVWPVCFQMFVVSVTVHDHTNIYFFEMYVNVHGV